MKRILVLPDGNFLAHVSRTLGIAKALRQEGHQVIFAGDGKYMRLPAEIGFTVLPLKTPDLDREMRISHAGRVNYYTTEMVRFYVDEELHLFHEVNPDLVYCDFRLTASSSCELARVPLAVQMNAAWTNYFSAKREAPEHSVFTRVLGSKLTTKIIPLATRMVLFIDAASFRKFRQKMGLSERVNFFDIMRGDINLLLDIPEYYPTRNLPANFYYIGPITWEPEIDPPDLSTLDSGHPVLYITMGSSGDLRYLACALQLFENTEYQCLMTTAGLLRPQKIPPNFIVAEYAPGTRLLEKSDVLICQGGNGTIYQALSRGVPIVGIPSTIDQDFNMDRVISLGVGVLVHERGFSPESMLSAVNQVLTHPIYRQNAQKYRGILEGYHAIQTGAEILNRFMSG